MKAAGFASLTRRALLFGSLGLLGWLGLSKTPTERRRIRMNRLISAGQLGVLFEDQQNRLRDQIDWLARAAGLVERVGVNEPIRTDRLDVVISQPQFEMLTKCSFGNAVYDPFLKTIFIDQSLLIPDSLHMLGESSAISMFTLDDLPFIKSYMSFIIAHEIAHHQLRDEKGSKRPRAFFSASKNNADQKVDWRDEEQADEYAINLLISAYQNDSMPDWYDRSAAREAAGLPFADIGPSAAASAEVIAAVSLMTDVLLFAEGPYSPFFFDGEHPSFVDRALTAFNRVSQTESSGPPSQQLPALVEGAARKNRMIRWRAAEILLPYPVLHVAREGSNLVIGCHRPDPSDPHFRLDTLYRKPIDFTELRSYGAPILIDDRHHAWTHRVDDENELPGMELERSFSRIAQSMEVSTELDKLRRQMDTLHIFPAEENAWRDGKYAGIGWFAPSDAYGGLYIAQDDLAVAVGRYTGVKGISLGAPVYAGGIVHVPASVPMGGQMDKFKLFALEMCASTRPPRYQFLKPMPDENAYSFEPFPEFEIERVIDATPPGWRPLTGGIEGHSAIYAHDRWWALFRPNAETWGLIEALEGGPLQTVDGALFLSAFVRPGAQAGFAGDLSPSSPTLSAVSTRKILASHQNDSFYLFDLETRTMQLIFHPAAGGVAATDLGDGLVLFWISNGRKAYVVDAKRGGNTET